MVWRLKDVTILDQLGRELEDGREVFWRAEPFASDETFGVETRGRIEIVDASAGRFRPEVEAAMYYCCLEAVQNAYKHAGTRAPISIRLYTDADELRLEVRDDGSGFDVASVDVVSGWKICGIVSARSAAASRSIPIPARAC